VSTTLAEPSTPLEPTIGARIRSWRRPALVVAVVLGVGLLATALTLSGAAQDRLDPDGAAPQGARALRVLLEDQGVAVTRVTTSAAALSAAGPDGTLVVVASARLGDAALDRLAAYRGDLVLVEPSQRVLAALAPEITLGTPIPSEVRDPGCGYDVATRAGRADGGGLAAVSSTPSGGTVDLCYGGPDGAGLVHLVHPGGRVLVVLGSGAALTNDLLGNEGNASLGLGVLGGHGRLTWLMSGPELDGAGQKSVSELLPRGVGLAALQLVVVVLLLALWRGRRLGPLVVEPLPTVIRAAETTEGRARLYRRARATGPAASALRGASIRRLLPLVGLGPAASAAETTPVVAARSGMSTADVHALLFGPAPGDDAALVRLKAQLDALERTVRRS
jgi:hypothetical protein